MELLKTQSLFGYMKKQVYTKYYCSNALLFECRGYNELVSLLVLSF